MTITLTTDERAEADDCLAELLARGYVETDQYQHLTAGARIRHVGQKYWQAYKHGTGNILHVCARYERDLELVVIYDEPRFEGLSRVTVLADYHVEVIR